MTKQDSVLTGVVEELGKASRGEDTVEVGYLIDALDHRGYGPALAVLPLIELTPVGGVPGFPTLLALTLAIITVRLLLGYEHFWAPQWLRRRRLESGRIIKSVAWLKPISLWMDSRLHERLMRFAGPTGRRAACIVILCLLLAVPPLELVPFATSAPMIIIAIFGLGLLYGDGLLMLLGFVGATIAIAVGLGSLVTAGGLVS
ncbi:MAG: exopolysaccharide biosynthesis protein [Hoeflea sp.]|uniref:exopolysaccharide biosynthesis protein n=1 Tax=Hoeflea sp. TaxID=1940281 RepID=UPI001D580686|nr:exopolysaccharide biosynthesis protein [Hoeflea sp.]MBU4527272.1 exopolysaccharide biosynthesis protein [Alphaproteobacteria bacterium]MBU4546945.1 exopolysaccharide biosynthesis protein [Alphaproteobacteria bacterium]MBU4551543.1 exopolysaccharide biosynthesis protein [Alphaproteobacteria bacterium]MBV1725548.1 exopolysaccharide biosynthesis protein [Hoeflea sp.]MBV1759596.1 exopolysaccharide biosynthesis protein [Hoeflea sp.]